MIACTSNQDIPYSCCLNVSLWQIWQERAIEAQVGNVDFYGVLVLLEGILQLFFYRVRILDTNKFTNATKNQHVR